MSICIKDQIQNMNIVIGCTVGCAYCYARNNVKRWHMIDDFAAPEFFPGKLKMMEKKRPQNFLLTGMSDLSGWKPEWRDEVLAKIRENPQHQFLFLTKRPDLLDFDTDLENAWFGVTVTRKAELWRIDALRKNVRAKHYHVTFEPLFALATVLPVGAVNIQPAGGLYQSVLQANRVCAPRSRPRRNWRWHTRITAPSSANCNECRRMPAYISQWTPRRSWGKQKARLLLQKVPELIAKRPVR